MPDYWRILMTCHRCECTHAFLIAAGTEGKGGSYYCPDCQCRFESESVKLEELVSHEPEKPKTERADS